MKTLPELLAPAGTLDGLKTAILYGANAVYAGVPGFSMRARAKITTDEMKQGTEVTFILPGTDKVTVKLDKLIDTKTGEQREKMSAGQGSSIKIPKTALGEAGKHFEPLILGHKKKYPSAK